VSIVDEMTTGKARTLRKMKIAAKEEGITVIVGIKIVTMSRTRPRIMMERRPATADLNESTKRIHARLLGITGTVQLLVMRIVTSHQILNSVQYRLVKTKMAALARSNWLSQPRRRRSTNHGVF
jgi:hypothetical protein